MSMRIDRKLFLIAPSLVLVLIVAGLFYTATRLRQIVEASDNWAARDAYVASIERGQRELSAAKAVQLVRLSLDAERRRTGAIEATRELLVVLGLMTLGCAAMLLATIRGVPRTEPLRGPVLFRSAPEST
jgi:hypothetical protein